MIARYVKRLGRIRVIENRQDSLDRINQVRANPSPVPIFIKPFQPSMLESPDHQSTL